MTNFWYHTFKILNFVNKFTPESITEQIITTSLNTDTLRNTLFGANYVEKASALLVGRILFLYLLVTQPRFYRIGMSILC